ncbi:Nramp family divalent metal transporter [Actinomarinicola tropica]|uniref:Divalent metal cation transporter n=1 Tax=Actinomarinicola tropica TaxID=2789776 RepID=A0A5Q2RHA3_9ACTN|nr:Nramp family divalent metal transporter [Actinomarinicola tropica]QGG93921.1 divalent metal cation transporter [Actinomarinicola tropica]
MSVATSAPDQPEIATRAQPPEAPSGRKILPWIGPGLLWMISAVGTGSVLFTPRVASQHRYALLWVLLAVCLLMWVMIREAARYTVVTGRSLLEGFARLPGPARWAVWVVLVPQVVAAVAGIAGLASIVGSALETAVGGDHRLWAAGAIVAAAVLVVTDGYPLIEKAARYLAAVLTGITVVAAVRVGPSLGDLGAGLVPSLPDGIDPYVVGPWIGTILAGSMGIVWFSYWTAARGFGGRSPLAESPDTEDDEIEPLGEEDRHERIHAWMRLMSTTAAVGVVAGAIVLVAYMVLGAELLAPEGILPQGSDVAADLSRLLQDVWGRTGFWLMIAAVLVALGGSVLANQDGWGRSFADMTIILRRGHGLPAWATRRRLTELYVLTLTGVLPIVVVLLVSDPVAIMSASGLVAALHTPLIVGLIVAVNRRDLPDELGPGWVTTGLTGSSVVVYTVVGALQVIG